MKNNSFCLTTMDKKSRGMSSLTSMLIALALSIVPILLLTASGAYLRVSQTQSHTLLSQIIVHQHMRDIVRASDAAGFYFPPRIHPQGLITLANGEIVFPSTTPALFADRLSDAITWYENDLGTLLKVRSLSVHQPDGAAAIYECCPVFGSSIALPAEKSLYNAVTRDGIFELKEVADHVRGKDNCISLTLEAHESILGLERDQYQKQGALFILPVKRINSLYRDTQGTLRLVSTRGSEVMENQPIREHAPLLRYRLTQSPSGIPILETTIEPVSQTSRTRRIELPIRGLIPSYLNLFTYL